MNGQSDTYLKDFAIFEDIKLSGVGLMKNYNREYGSFILNLDYQNRGGTHWVALIHMLNDKHEECYYYFDSFGYKPHKELKSKTGNIKIYYSNVQFQQITSSDCGIWCLLFLKLAGYFNVLSVPKFHYIIEYIKELNIVWQK